MEEWLDNNDIWMYSTYNEGNSVITEMFVKTLKAKFYIILFYFNSNFILVIWIN